MVLYYIADNKVRKAMKDDELPEKVERLHEIIRKYKVQVENLKTQNRKLKSQLKTAETAWTRTEKFLENVSEGRSLEEMIKDANSVNGFSKESDSCRKCKKSDICILKYQNFRVIVCAGCGFKEKINEPKNN